MTDWSPQEVLRLRELATAGYSQSQIGKVLGRTKSSVSGKMLRLGKRRAPTPPTQSETAVRDRRMVADFRSGMTQRQLAAKYGLEVGSVSARLSHLGERITIEERVRRQRASMIRNGSKPGRKPIWPDCPPQLRNEYLRLRNHYGIPAAEARALLEKDCPR